MVHFRGSGPQAGAARLAFGLWHSCARCAALRELADTPGWRISPLPTPNEGGGRLKIASGAASHASERAVSGPGCDGIEAGCGVDLTRLLKRCPACWGQRCLFPAAWHFLWGQAK